jgi:hypothetical protein
MRAANLSERRTVGKRWRRARGSRRALGARALDRHRAVPEIGDAVEKRQPGE